MRAPCLRARRAAFAVSLCLAASVLLLGCQDLLNAISDSAAPTGVSASDGDSATSIDVSWGTPNLSSDKWAGYSITGYDLTWDVGPLPHNTHVSGNSYSIPVSTGDQAKEYSITVQTTLTGGSASGGSASDTGFALPPTQDLLWHDGGKDYIVAGSEQWYVTMLQKGFTYNFDFHSGTGTVEFYRYKTLDLVGGPVSGSLASWTCDDGGKANKFYVHVVPSLTSFNASYSF